MAIILGLGSSGHRGHDGLLSRSLPQTRLELPSMKPGHQQGHILWMDEILHHLRNPGMMSPLKIPTNKGFKNGLQMVQDFVHQHIVLHVREPNPNGQSSQTVGVRQARFATLVKRCVKNDIRRQQTACWTQKMLLTSLPPTPPSCTISDYCGGGSTYHAVIRRRFTKSVHCAGLRNSVCQKHWGVRFPPGALSHP